MLSDVAIAFPDACALAALLGYIGPGAGLDLVGALIGLLATLGTSLVFIVLWPIRLLCRGRRRDSDLHEETTVNQ